MTDDTPRGLVLDTGRTRRPILLFLGAALLVTAVEALVVRSLAFGARPELVGGAVTLDLVVVLPLLWLWLAVRRAGVPAVTVAPVIVAAWITAKWVLPAGGESWLLAAAELAPALELGVLAYLAVRVRRVADAYRRGDEADPVLRLRQAVGRILGRDTASRLVADEVTTLRYLVHPPPTPPPNGTRAFTCHRTSGWGGVVLALSVAVAVEAVAVHALVARWSVAAAWVLTALSLYGLLWLVSDWRATRARPLLLEEERLLVRTGLRWTVRVPLDRVTDVRRASPDAKATGEPSFSTAAFGPPNVLVELTAPVTVEGPFGIDRDVRLLGLAVDEPDRLVAALESAVERD